MNGGPNRVPERPKWLIWTVCSYYIYRECVLSENESARAKIFTTMLPGSQMNAMRQLGFPRSMGLKRWFPHSYAAGE